MWKICLCCSKYDNKIDETLVSVNNFFKCKARNPYTRLRMRVRILYGKYQNTKINREGILIYGYVCIYAWYSNALKSYDARCMTYTQTRIWIPSLILRKEGKNILVLDSVLLICSWTVMKNATLLTSLPDLSVALYIRNRGLGVNPYILYGLDVRGWNSPNFSGYLYIKRSWFRL